MTDEQQREPQQPQQSTAPKQPDALDLLGAQLVGLQSMLAVLGGAVYASLVHVNQLMAERGKVPSQPSPGQWPANGAPQMMTRAGLADVLNEAAAAAGAPFAGTSQSRSTFNRKRQPEPPPANASPEQVAAYREQLAATADVARVAPEPEAPPAAPAPPAPEAERITSADVGELPRGVLDAPPPASPSPDTTEGQP